MLKVRFEFEKMVSYWNKEHGAGVKVDGERDMSNWHNNVDYLDKTITLDDISEVQTALENLLNKEYLPSDYFLIMDEGRISFNALEDNEGNTLDGEQADELHEKGEQVYLCDYSVSIEIQEVYEPTVEQLQNMFPRAEY